MQTANTFDTTDLGQLESAFRSFLDAASVMMWVSDTNGRLIFFNRSWLQFTGRTLEEELSHEWTGDEIHADDRESCFNLYKTSFTTAQPFDQKYRLLRNDGEYRWVHERVKPYNDKFLSQAGFVGSCVDITQDKQQKEELERSNEELDKFAYVASHDLKAPLRGIDQLATWIVEDFDDKEATKNHLQVMRKRVKRMEKLLDDLLEYSRIGRTQTKLKEVDTRTLLEISFELASPPEAFQIELDQRLPTFKTFAVPFELILRNLISNAVKHHDRKDGKITVTVEDNGDAYLFKIQDDGPGIVQKHHEKIFEIFQTLKPRDQVEGSGMGLAMIKKIVTTYGGSITVLSETGQGACFCLTWPKFIVAAQEDSGDSAPPDKSERMTA